MPSPSAITVYAQLLEDPVSAEVRLDDGSVRPLPVGRWLGEHTRADEEVAASVVGPALDVGCGPGRLLDALARNGTWALGVDLSPAAVAAARRHGRRAVLGCIFDDVPRSGHWRTALLLDGNIGIGGDPKLLLTRLGGLLQPSGVIVAEVEPPGSPTRSGDVRIETGDTVSAWFPWAHVSVDDIREVAATAGRTVRALRPIEDRWFAWLV